MMLSSSAKRLPLRSLSKRAHRRNYNTSHYILPVFDLSKYCPCDAIENYLHSMHDVHGIPYIAAICTIPLLTKFLIRFPFDVACTKIYESQQPLIPDINEQKFESLLTILQKKRKTDVSVFQQYVSLSMKQVQHKFVHKIPTLVGLYFHLSCYIAIERMTFHQSVTDTALVLTNEYLSSTDFILPVVNGFGFMLFYAYYNRWKFANFKARRRNVYLSLLFMPWSMLFLSSGFQFYLSSNLVWTALYAQLTMQNTTFQKAVGLLSNSEKIHQSNMIKMSDLYIEWNHENFRNNSHRVFISSFANGERETHWTEDVAAVYNAENLYVPTLPPRDFFRNVEDDIEYFDDEYDEFVERIDAKHEQRYLESNVETILLETRDTLSLDDEDEKRYLEQHNAQKLSS